MPISAFKNKFPYKNTQIKHYGQICKSQNSIFQLLLTNDDFSVSTPYIDSNTRSQIIYSGGDSTNSIRFLDTLENKKYMLSGHRDRITDLAFNPFDPNIFASCSNDFLLKIWNIDDNRKNAMASIDQYDCELNSIAFSRTANNIIGLSSSKNSVFVVDIENQDTILSIDDLFGNQYDYEIVDLNQTQDCSRLICVAKSHESISKGNSLIAFDPRIDSSTLSIDLKMRPHTCIPLYDNYIMVTCQGSSRSPFIYIFDLRKLGSSTAILNKQTNFSSGHSLAIFDSDTKLLSIATRGSPSIHLIDLGQGLIEFREIYKYFGAESCQAFCSVPKTCLSLDKCEVFRALNLTSSKIESLSYQVPRKIEKYDEKLYPATFSHKPCMNADEYLAQPLKKDQNSIKTPILIDILKLTQNLENKEESEVKEEKDDFEKKEEEENYEIRKLGSLTKSKARINLDQKFKHSPFLHTFGVEPNTLEQTYNHIQPLAPTVNIPLYENIQANKRQMCFPQKSTVVSGLRVHSLDPKKQGRSIYDSKNQVALIRGHSEQLSSFSLSNVDQNLLATASNDGRINIWNIPEQGLPEEGKDLNDSLDEFELEGKIRKIVQHNAVDRILACAIESYGTNDLLALDTTSDKQLFMAEGIQQATIQDVSQSLKNLWLIATTCKDKYTRILDQRCSSESSSKCVVNSFIPKKCCQRDTRVLQTNNPNQLILCGFGDKSMRSISVYDLRNMSDKADGIPVSTHEIGISHSSLIPFYDEDTSLLFVTAVGDKNFHIMAINDFKIDVLSGQKSQFSDRACLGIGVLPKSNCDVRKVEIASIVKLTSSAIIPISFCVPRRRKEYFQDDLYPETRIYESRLSNSDQIAGKSDKEQKIRFESLRPEFMQNLSEAPDPQLSEHQKRYLKTLEEEKKKAQDLESGNTYLSHDEAIDKWQKMTMSAPSVNRQDAPLRGPQDDVDEEEQGDEYSD